MSNTSKSAKPFMFDTSFDPPRFVEEKKKSTPKEAPPPPTFTLEDLEQARAEAIEEGRAAAFQEAAAGLEERAVRIIENMTAQISDLAAKAAEDRNRSEALAAELIRRIAERVMPAMTATHGLQEIEGLLCECLPLIEEDAKVVLRVPEDAAPEVEKRFNDLAERNALAIAVNVIPEPDYGPSDCRIDWGDGGAERSYDAIWAELDGILAKSESNWVRSPGDDDQPADNTMPEGDATGPEPTQEAAEDVAPAGTPAEETDLQGAPDNDVIDDGADNSAAEAQRAEAQNS